MRAVCDRLLPHLLHAWRGVDGGLAHGQGTGPVSCRNAPIFSLVSLTNVFLFFEDVEMGFFREDQGIVDQDLKARRQGFLDLFGGFLVS